MKLYYALGACSLAPHIVAREAVLKIDLDKPWNKLGEKQKDVLLYGTGDKRFNVTWEVAVARLPRDVEWEGRGPMGTKARVSYDLEPRGDGTCFNYVNEYELPGGFLGKIGGKAFQRNAAKEADRTLVKLKGLLER